MRGGENAGVEKALVFLGAGAAVELFVCNVGLSAAGGVAHQRQPCDR